MLYITLTMETLAYVVFHLILSAGIKADFPEIKEESIKKNVEVCDKLGKNPYFESELVVGLPWRVYHTWNMNLNNKCIDIAFKNATKAITSRIWSDMYEYLEQQPYWESAALVMTTGWGRQELLLFPAQGVEGAFLAVPNVIRGRGMTPLKGSVPLMKFILKLVRGGKFLVMMDCHIGITSLAARANEPPYRSEIGMAVSELDLGDGFSACTLEKNKNELEPLE